MINQIKVFKTNALALEMVDKFTEADANLIEKLYQEKLDLGYKKINILIKVKDLSVITDMTLKGFFKGELWGIKHFGSMGKCAVVSHSSVMKSVINAENKFLHLFNKALDEKYFDEADLESALKFIAPEE